MTKLQRKVTIENGIVSQDVIGKIDNFLKDVEKMNLTTNVIQIIKEALEKDAVKNECKDPTEFVGNCIKKWFKEYLTSY
jgi:hypothetical protein